MKVNARHAVAAVVLSPVIVALTLWAPTGSATSRVRAVPDELIVGFEKDTPEAARGQALQDASAKIRKKFDRIGAVLVSVPNGRQDQTLEQLRHNKHVRYVEPNAVVSADDLTLIPDDASFEQLWGLDNSGQTVNFISGTPDADIDAPEAWGVTTGSASVVVAVVDTGIDYNHPDLAANIWVNPGENCRGCRTNGVDDDHNGYIDDWRGWDFLNNDNDPSDDNGHGTHVAGTIGAVGDNGIGVTGVDWTASLMPLKFIGADGTGTVADAVSAVLYASANGARVMNASWGSDEFSQALLDAIRVGDGSGSLFVAAAGNSFSNTDTSPHYPSSYDVPNLISVAATDNRDQRAWFSNYGSRSVDLGAPGVGIYSTWPGAAYESLDGTSMATPHVSGAAALVEAAFPGATGVGTKALLLRSVDLLPSLSGRTTTGGRLNANSAVRCTFNPELVVAAPQGAVDAYVGETVQLAVLAAACGDPAGVTVTASAGGLPIALSARGDGLFTGGYTLTTVGAVSIEISASAGSTTDTKTISVAVSPSYAITPDGTPVTVTTTMAGQNARLTFSGNAGQRVTLKLSAGTIGLEKVSLVAPDRSTVFSSTYGNSGFVDVRTLAAAGSYALLVDPIGANTGSLTLALYDVPPDLVATVSPGGAPVNVSTTVPGQSASLVFTGNAGQRISLGLSAGTIGLEKVSLLAPDGSTVFSSTYGNSGFVDVRTLAAAGSYALVVDPIGANTGSLTLALYDVPPDLSSTISAGGPPVTVTTTVPGQNGRLTFSGNAGQRVSLKLSSGTMAQEKVSLLAPDGSTVFSSTFANTGFVDVRTLATSGGYALVVDPAAANTGSLTLNLYDVPPDVVGTISAGGAAFTVTTTAPGQSATIVFSGNLSQRISLALSAGTMGQEKMSFLAPDGSTLFSSTFGNSGFVDVRTLAAAGSYALVVDPIGANTGSLTLTLYDVPPDTSSPIGVGGAPVTVRTTVPGQNAVLTFSGNAGQAVSLKLSAVTMSSTRVSILNPDTSTLVAPRTFGTAGGTVTVTLPTAGTYTIVVDPQVSATGSMTLTLT